MIYELKFKMLDEGNRENVLREYFPSDNDAIKAAIRYGKDHNAVVLEVSSKIVLFKPLM